MSSSSSSSPVPRPSADSSRRLSLCGVTLRLCGVTLRLCGVTLRLFWVTLRLFWLTLRLFWVSSWEVSSRWSPEAGSSCCNSLRRRVGVSLSSPNVRSSAGSARGSSRDESVLVGVRSLAGATSLCGVDFLPAIPSPLGVALLLRSPRDILRSGAEPEPLLLGVPDRLRVRLLSLTSGPEPSSRGVTPRLCAPCDILLSPMSDPEPSSRGVAPRLRAPCDIPLSPISDPEPSSRGVAPRLQPPCGDTRQARSSPRGTKALVPLRCWPTTGDGPRPRDASEPVPGTEPESSRWRLAGRPPEGGTGDDRARTGDAACPPRSEAATGDFSLPTVTDCRVRKCRPLAVLRSGFGAADRLRAASSSDEHCGQLIPCRRLVPPGAEWSDSPSHSASLGGSAARSWADRDPRLTASPGEVPRLTVAPERGEAPARAGDRVPTPPL